MNWGNSAQGLPDSDQATQVALNCLYCWVEIDFAHYWEAVDLAEAELVAALLYPEESVLDHFGPDGSAEAIDSVNEFPDHFYRSQFWVEYVYLHQAGVANDSLGHFCAEAVGLEAVDDYLYRRGAEHTRYRT